MMVSTVAVEDLINHSILWGNQMKKTILILSSLFWLSTSSAQISCDDLDDLVGSLDDLADALESVEEIGINSYLDSSLGELTEALKAVAYVEQDRYLTAGITDLNIAWNDMEREDFEIALDDISERLDELGDRDCEGW